MKKRGKCGARRSRELNLIAPRPQAQAQSRELELEDSNHDVDGKCSLLLEPLPSHGFIRNAPFLRQS